MALGRFSRVGGAAGALALALVAASSAGAKPTQRAEAGRLTGQLLIAAPGLSDPRFSRTVIYVVHHDAGGALGLVVNRPFKEVPISLLLESLGQEHAGVRGSMRIHYGGPVEPGRVFILHTPDYRSEDTHVIGEGIAVTTAPGILRAIGTGVGPRHALLVLSYSGWAAGQLEREIRAGDWIPAPADAALVFDEDYETKWQRAMGRREVGKIDL